MNADKLDLSGANEKLERAKEHYSSLNDEVLTARLSTSPAEPIVVQVENTSGDGRLLTLRVARMPEYPTARWGAIVGDVVNNLRSAIDHIAYQSVLVGKTPTTTHLSRSQFPICDDETAFHEAAPDRLAGVPSTILNIIESRQPFHYGDVRNSPLHNLRELSNRDKHRLLTPVLFASDDISFEQFNLKGGRLFKVEVRPHQPLAVGAEVATLHVEPMPEENPTVEIPSGIPTYITLSDPAGYASVWIDAMIGAVGHIRYDIEDAWAAA